MIDQLYQDEINRTLDEQQEQPGPPKIVPTGMFAGFWRAPGAIPAGVATGAAAAVDLQTGAARLEASQGLLYSPATHSYVDIGIDDSSRALQAKIAAGKGNELFTSDAGQTLRSTAKDLMPDPKTTGKATQVVAGLLNFGAQAVPSIAAGGPVMGPVMLGTSAGMERSDALADQGVDLATREKAGLSAGAFTAASMIPAVGASRLARFATGAVAGEAAMVGQTAVEKHILQANGYQQLADQYDPFDPVTLGLGLVPGVFSALHAPGGHVPETGAAPAGPAGGGAPPALHDIVTAMESGGQRFGPDGELLTSPAGAQGEMQVMPATGRDPGFGVKPAADDSPEELARVGHDYLDAMFRRYQGDTAKALAAYNDGPGNVDKAIADHPDDWLSRLPQETQAYVARGTAAHAAVAAGAGDPAAVSAALVRNAARALDDSRLTDDSDLAGRDVHQAAIETAFDQIGRGEPVSISPAFGDAMLDSMRESRMTEDRIDFLEGQRAQLLGDAGRMLEPGEAANLHQQLAALQSQLVDAGPAAVKARAAELQGKNVSYKQASAAAQRELSAKLSDQQAQIQRLQEQLAAHAAGAQATEKLSFVERDLAAAREREAALPGPRTSPRRLALALANVFQEMRTPEAEAMMRAPVGKPAAAREAAAGTAEPSAAPAPAEAARAEPRAREAVAQAPTAATSVAARRPIETPSHTQSSAAVAELERWNPDLQVQVDGMERPMRLADFMAAVREEAARAPQDARLIEIAAQCAIGR